MRLIYPHPSFGHLFLILGEGSGSEFDAWLMRLIYLHPSFGHLFLTLGEGSVSEFDAWLMGLIYPHPSFGHLFLILGEGSASEFDAWLMRFLESTSLSTEVTTVGPSPNVGRRCPARRMRVDQIYSTTIFGNLSA
jgi:hypothetical protein